MNLKGVDVVLVPFDDLTVLHRRWLDRHQFVQPVMGQDETARMLGEMTRRADQFAGEIESQTQTPVIEIEVQFLRVLRLDPFPRPAPDLRGQHLMRSSGRPSALPTSRNAPLAR